MTKNFPDKLCVFCEEFDYSMNRMGGISLDVFVVCECDEEPISMDQKMTVENIRIAKQAYEEIVAALTQIEDMRGVTFSLPDFIEVNGQKFETSELYLISNNNGNPS